MRKLFIALFASAFWVFPANAENYSFDASQKQIEELAYLPSAIPNTWKPISFLDLLYPWPEKYLERFGQPFNAITFEKNSHAVSIGIKKSVPHTNRMASYLAFVADQYIEEKGECLYVYSNFKYPFLWMHFKKRFRGAFLNNVTASGFIDLYKGTGEKKYLDTAYRLLKTTAFCNDPEVKLSARDADGYLWLNEYVFQLEHEKTRLSQAVGLQDDGNGWYRARVFNGHIISIAAFLKYRLVSNTHEFDGIIQESIQTMDRYLPEQLYNGRYFSYMSHFAIWPDYGQERAVRLADSLCDITKSDSICEAASSMRFCI